MVQLSLYSQTNWFHFIANQVLKQTTINTYPSKFVTQTAILSSCSISSSSLSISCPITTSFNYNLQTSIYQTKFVTQTAIPSSAPSPPTPPVVSPPASTTKQPSSPPAPPPPPSLVVSPPASTMKPVPSAHQSLTIKWPSSPPAPSPLQTSSLVITIFIII